MRGYVWAFLSAVTAFFASHNNSVLLAAAAVCFAVASVFYFTDGK